MLDRTYVINAMFFVVFFLVQCSKEKKEEETTQAISNIQITSELCTYSSASGDLNILYRSGSFSCTSKQNNMTFSSPFTLCLVEERQGSQKPPYPQKGLSRSCSYVNDEQDEYVFTDHEQGKVNVALNGAEQAYTLSCSGFSSQRVNPALDVRSCSEYFDFVLSSERRSD